jgi:hypothetical protein
LLTPPPEKPPETAEEDESSTEVIQLKFLVGQLKERYVENEE